MYLKFPKKTRIVIKITTADKWFSKYIRIRDSNTMGYVSCCTCGRYMFWKDSQCGHYMTRDKKQTRFNEQNCNTQCPKCNDKRYGNGEQAIHGLYINKKYGPGTAEKLIHLSRVKGFKQTKIYLKTISDEYRLKTKAIAKEKGIELK